MKNKNVIEVKTPAQKNPFSNAKPILRIKSDLNPERFLTGEKAINIIKEVNGNRTVADISSKLQYDEKEVFNICKNLMKMGLMSFCM